MCMDEVKIDALYERIRANEGDKDGCDVNELFNAFWNGYDIGRLRELFDSFNEEVVADAAFILTELGYKGKPLLDVCWNLLDSNELGIVADCLDVILVNADHRDGDMLAKAMMLIHAQEDPVQWKTLGVISKMSLEQLEASVGSKQLGNLTGYVRWLIRQDKLSDPNEIKTRVEGDDKLASAFGAIAALRAKPPLIELLEYVAVSIDGPIGNFASGELEFINMELSGSYTRH